MHSEGAAMFVYLHGFNSSPASFKARLLHERLSSLGRGAEFVAPELPPRPREAVAVVEALVRNGDPDRVTLVGSSLGGHYATWVAERHGTRAVLVNPAIRPHALLAGALGPQVNLHSGARYELTQAHLDELRETCVDRITRPGRYLLIVAMGDEVLDSQVALAMYRDARHIVHPGGDHGFGDFGRYLDDVLAFGDRPRID
jgi:predicted esterase YcpF (UPF0227 family)